MKKAFCVILALVMLMAACVCTEASTVYTNGESVTFFNESPWYIGKDGEWTQGTYPGMLYNGVLYVSLVDFQRAMGCYAEHNTNDNSVCVKFRDKEIWQGVGYTGLYINNVRYENPMPFVAENGAVMIPAEPYASVAGYQGWFETPADYLPGKITLTIPVKEYRLTDVAVNQAAQLVTVYGVDQSGNRAAVRHMICSTGVGGSTPNGSYRINPLGRWYYFSKFNCYVMYASQVTGDVCFHSIPFNGRYYSALSSSGYSVIGSPASHGCIRLFIEDAKFLHNECAYLPLRISWGYTNSETSAIRSEILGKKKSYSEYVRYLQANDF